MQTSSKLSQRFLAGIVAGLATILFAVAVFANAAAIPPRYWFNFSTNQSALSLQSFQVAWCNSATQCQPPKLIIIDHAVGSKSFQVHPKFDSSNFKYADNTLLWSKRSPIDNLKYLQIVGQYRDAASNQTRSITSNIFSFTGSFFSVTASNQSLLVQPQEKNLLETRTLTFFNFVEFHWSLLLIGLSLGSELLIAFFYLRWLKFSAENIGSMIIFIILMHCFSLLIVWKSFPAMATFITPGERASGVAWLLLSLIYPLLLIGFSKKKPITKENRIIRSIIFLGFTWVFSGAFWILEYGSPAPDSNGLLSAWVLPTSEVFVWLYEAWILAIVAQPRLSLKQTLSMSLVMNAVSFGLGWVFVQLLDNY